jgi:hypothetical protein
MSVTASAVTPLVASGEPVISDQGGTVTIGLLDERGRVTAYVPMDAEATRACIAALTASLARIESRATVIEVLADAWHAAVTGAASDDHLDAVHAWLTAHPLDA